MAKTCLCHTPEKLATPPSRRKSPVPLIDTFQVPTQTKFYPPTKGHLCQSDEKQNTSWRVCRTGAIQLDDPWQHASWTTKNYKPFPTDSCQPAEISLHRGIMATDGKGVRGSDVYMWHCFPPSFSPLERFCIEAGVAEKGMKRLTDFCFCEKELHIDSGTLSFGGWQLIIVEWVVSNIYAPSNWNFTLHSQSQFPRHYNIKVAPAMNGKSH